ncbi:MAG: hypothetical protein NZ534_11815, partial [Bacteroidia bacterium]|nr:hypothetical protein [Bacteroidia bacterium]
MFDQIQRQFITELGWDYPQSAAPLRLSDLEPSLVLKPLAQVAGFVVFYCDQLPPPPQRNAVQKILAQIEPENLCVYQGKIWQFAFRQGAKPIRIVEKSLPIEVQELLERIKFDYQDFERPPTTAETADKVRRSFQQNAEKVTKSFYERFKNHHALFAQKIVGLDCPVLRERYAGLTLNRLMFLYFIQKKGFLLHADGRPDYDYLKNRLHLPR